jgi:YkoY family integral membrane protein
MSYFAVFFAQLHVVWGQTVEPTDLAVIGLLILLEGVLSIDNALVLGLLAKRLPRDQRPRALSYGLVGAFVFRLIAIATATFLLQWTFAKFLGGAYLVYIAVRHLFFEAKEERPDELIVDDEGGLQLVDSVTHQPLSREREELELKERLPFDLNGTLEGGVQTAVATKDVTGVDRRKFWWTVFVIEMTDIAFAVDSIVAAIGVVGGKPPGTPETAPHPKLWVVILGGFLGVVVMRFAATAFIRLLEKFPRFEVAAYLLVIVIGGKLLLDWGFNSNWQEWGWTVNQVWAESYVDWLRAHWPLRLSEKGQEHPHLLDFHDLRRPECLLFWLFMLITFCVGFIPRRTDEKGYSVDGKM